MYAGIVLFRRTRYVLLKIWSLPGSATGKLRSILAAIFFGRPRQEPAGRQPDAAPAPAAAGGGGVGLLRPSGRQPPAAQAEPAQAEPEPEHKPEPELRAAQGPPEQQLNGAQVQQEPVLVGPPCGVAVSCLKHTSPKHHECPFLEDLCL